MSHVADIILVTAIDDGAQRDEEHPNADLLSKWLQENKGQDWLKLVKVDQHAGGNKAIQCDIFLAAINYLDIDGFVAAFRSIRWHMPECAQLMIKDEHDDLFTVYTALAE